MNRSHRVLFYADTHSYWAWSEKWGQYRKVPSVGSIISKMKPNFEKEYWLSVKAAQAVDPTLFKAMMGGKNTLSFSHCRKVLDKFLEEIGDTTQYFEERQKISEQWLLKNGVANHRGTNFHEAREDEERLQGFGINPWNGKKIKHRNPTMDWANASNHSITDNLKDLESGYYTELLVFMEDEDGEVILCGQVDRGFVSGKTKRSFSIDDYKTNEKKPSKSDMNRMYPPFSHLYASKFETYRIQMSLYAYMMELCGYNIGKLQYTWYKNYEVNSALAVPLKYDSKQMKQIVDLHLFGKGE